MLLSAAYRLTDEKTARVENDFIAAQVARDAKRVIGFCGVHVKQAWAVRELERCSRQLHLAGLKLHPNAQGLDLGDAQTRRRLGAVLKRAGELGMVAPPRDARDGAHREPRRGLEPVRRRRRHRAVLRRLARARSDRVVPARARHRPRGVRLGLSGLHAGGLARRAREVRFTPAGIRGANLTRILDEARKAAAK